STFAVKTTSTGSAARSAPMKTPPNTQASNNGECRWRFRIIGGILEVKRWSRHSIRIDVASSAPAAIPNQTSQEFCCRKLIIIPNRIGAAVEAPELDQEAE